MPMTIEQILDALRKMKAGGWDDFVADHELSDKEADQLEKDANVNDNGFRISLIVRGVNISANCDDIGN